MELTTSVSHVCPGHLGSARSAPYESEGPAWGRGAGGGWWELEGKCKQSKRGGDKDSVHVRGKRGRIYVSLSCGCKSEGEPRMESPRSWVEDHDQVV